jgi:NDP-sugar pyrophosphorylase family protein
MHYIDYGLGAFRRSVFAELPEDERWDLATIFERLLQQGNLAAFEVRERFYEIGSRAGLRDTEHFLRTRE